MSLTELFILAVGVSMDAFAVAVCKGLSIRRLSWRHAVLVRRIFKRCTITHIKNNKEMPHIFPLETNIRHY